MSQPKNPIAEPAKPPHKPDHPAFDPQHQGGKPLQRQDIDHDLSERNLIDGLVSTEVDVVRHKEARPSWVYRGDASHTLVVADGVHGPPEHTQRSRLGRKSISIPIDIET